MKQTIYAKIISSYIVLMLMLSALPMFIEDSSGYIVSSVVDSSIATQYGTSFNTRKMVRLNDAMKSLGVIYSDETSGKRGVYFSKSSDNGITWGSPVCIYKSDNTYGCSVAVGKNNTIHVVYDVNTYQIRYNFSLDNGSTWSVGRIIVPGSTILQLQPSIAVDSMDNLHVVWSGTSFPGDSTWNIRYMKFTKTTGLWSAPTNLTTETGSRHQQAPTIAIDGNNNLHVAWDGQRPGIGYGLNVIRYRKYTNATLTWGAKLNVSIEGYDFDQMWSSIAINNSNGIHLVWYGRNAVTGTYQIIRHRSSPDGVTWGSFTTASSSTPANYCYEPSISIDGNNKIFVTWKMKTTTKYDDYVSNSTNGGTTFGTSTAIIADAYDNYYPNLFWSYYPNITGYRTNTPKTGYCFVYTKEASPNMVKYHGPTELTWYVSTATPMTVSFVSPTLTNGSAPGTSVYVRTYSFNPATNHYLINDFTSNHLNNDLVGWWRMEQVDGSGRPYDNSTYGNHATTKYGTPLQSTTMKNYGNTMYFDGNTDSFSTAMSTSFENLGNYSTFSFWAKSSEDFTSFAYKTRGIIKLYSTSDNFTYIAFNKTMRKLYIARQCGLVGDIWAISNDLGTGFITNWHFYSVVFTNSIIYTYIDGVARGSGAWSPPTYPGIGSMPKPRQIWLGKGTAAAANNSMFGYLDDITIFNRSLTLGEIKSLYNGTTYQYDQNFIGLAPGKYTYKAYAVNTTGRIKSTETRWRNLSTPPTFIPGIHFIAPTPANGTSSINYIPVSINSTGASHYTFLDFDEDNILWMTMDKTNATTGNPLDNSTHGNNGTKVGATQSATGKWGKSFYFPGAGHYINIPTSASLDSLDSTATFSFWAKSNNDWTTMPQSTAGIIRLWHNSTNRVYVSLAKTYAGSDRYALGWAMSLGPPPAMRLISGNLGLGFITNWHHYVVTMNASYVAGYIDGAFQGSQTLSDAFYPDLDHLVDNFKADIGVGAEGMGTYCWNGYIDDMIIFNRQLNLSEIRSLYDANTYQYQRNFTGLTNANYTFRGRVVDTDGDMNSTSIRWRNISVAYPPVVSIITPLNNSINQPLWTSCRIYVTDNNNDPMTVYWSDNSGGAWVVRHVDAGVISGSYIDWTFVDADTVNTQYWFRVAVNDGTGYNISINTTFRTADYYYILKGLTNGLVDWEGIPGASYWSNGTGATNETLEINVSGGTNAIRNIGVWVGDLQLQLNQTMTTGWNTIRLEQYVIDACPSNTIEDVLSSVYDYLYWVTNVGNTTNWYRFRNPALNTLTTIQANTMYLTKVKRSCELKILMDISINASNVTMQCSSDNTTWGTNIRRFKDGGNISFLNYTSWTIAKGCYGANPFIGNFTMLTKSIFCRFKLNTPYTMPSNHSYISLSVDQWKVYLYSTTTTTPAMPPTYPASLPPGASHLSLKWDTATLDLDGEGPPIAWDVNGDGIMEIFKCGTKHSSITTQRLVCVNGSTGALIWAKDWTWGTSEPTVPIGVYDFNKDGNYEVIIPGFTKVQCRSATNGSIVWEVTNPAEYGGNHQYAWIDAGDQVYIYLSGHDATPPYDAKIRKIFGSNGTTIKTAEVYYSCNGGTSIADINNDGKYEILISDRGQDQFPGTTAKSLRCYDEDLNLLWYAGYPTCSSHAPIIMDVNGDGTLEVIIGRENLTTGANSGVYIYNADGSIYHSQKTIYGVFLHNQPALADLDGDGNIELVYGNGPVGVFDLTTWTNSYASTSGWYSPPDIGNVILDAGITDNKLEIIACKGTTVDIYKYNLTTSLWEKKTTFSTTSAYTSVTNDIDHDGYNEILLTGNNDMTLYETKVPTLTPRARTYLQYYGERRQNNEEYYPQSFYNNPLVAELTFGGQSLIPQLTTSTFIPNVNSSRTLIELNGFYSIGNYTTLLNTTLYLPSPWTCDKFYIRILNTTTHALYENITTGFTIITTNPLYKYYLKIYNPAKSMIGVKQFDVDIYVTIKYGTVPIIQGNRTFSNLFRIYNITAPYNYTSSYNTTTTSLNLTWHAGNYTDRYIVVRKNSSSFPTSITDGYIVQNLTKKSYNESSVLSTRAYSVFGYNKTTRSFSAPLCVPWGAIGTNCFNESNPSQAIPFDLEVSNQGGTIVYKRTGLTNTHFIDVNNIPYGTNTVFILDSVGYKQRIYYKDIALNTFYNFSFYLPPSQTHGGNTTPPGDCTLRLYTNSINVSSYTSDAIITLSHPVEDIVTVEIYNRSLYISYGGWIMIPESKYTVTTTQITINKTVLDKNTSMARVTYYYLYCPGDVILTPLYYLRVVETIETEYSTYDRGVEGAKVDIKRYVNTTGIYVSVAQPLTDANGYVNVYLVPGVLYKVLITKTGYNNALADYIPAPANQFGQTAEKTFRITINESSITPGDIDFLFKNIIWSIEPTGIRHPGAFTIWFNITSNDNKLQWYSMRILFYNTTNYTWVTIFYQNDTNAGGGSISFNVPNVTGRYAIKCYFKKTGYPIQELGETGSLIHFIQYLKEWMHGIPDYAYYIVLILIMTVAMGFFFIYFGTGLSTGYIGLIIFAIGLFIHPISISIGTTSVSGWIIFAITFIMYTMGIFLWSKM